MTWHVTWLTYDDSSEFVLLYFCLSNLYTITQEKIA